MHCSGSSFISEGSPFSRTPRRVREKQGCIGTNSEFSGLKMYGFEINKVNSLFSKKVNLP
jgi:hypothetical protein